MAVLAQQIRGHELRGDRPGDGPDRGGGQVAPGEGEDQSSGNRWNPICARANGIRDQTRPSRFQGSEGSGSCRDGRISKGIGLRDEGAAESLLFADALPDLRRGCRADMRRLSRDEMTDIGQLSRCPRCALLIGPWAHDR